MAENMWQLEAMRIQDVPAVARNRGLWKAYAGVPADLKRSLMMMPLMDALEPLQRLTATSLEGADKPNGKRTRRRPCCASCGTPSGVNADKYAHCPDCYAQDRPGTDSSVKSHRSQTRLPQTYVVIRKMRQAHMR